MPENDHWQPLIHGLRTGDQAIIRDFVQQYAGALEGLADKNLPRGMRQRVGPEDVVQSACRTFLRRAQGGEFQLEDSESLWRLLCAITLTKVREQTRFHMRQKRSLRRETALPTASADQSAAEFPVAVAAPSPAEAAEFADQFRKLVAALNAEEQQVLDLKLQDLTNDEVADRLGRSERTIRRILKRVQAALTDAFGTTEEQAEPTP